MAAAVELPPPPAPSIHKQAAHSTQSCPSCGTSVRVDTAEVESARRKIVELEAQMEVWKEKATAAVDKCADFEDQIRSLQVARDQHQLPRSNTETYDPSRRSDEDPRPSTAGATSRPSRFSFLTGRRISPNNSTSQPPPSTSATPVDVGLLNELERERTLRAKAEERVQKVDSEIEELSVQLFSQANEMVAEERRARAKLEERVEMLEKKDKDKMARLDRLEKAVSRIDRVKAILNQPTTNGMGAGNVMLAPPSKR
ncbi:hypothetical protein FB567DRAFT_94607 [Paraphoma chrysanthemicola]|uniref:GDP/GTP exchange factor Sec2 N-terminal domain-containing protein n=1 Tax=Paraphoma chrysanthemicola TaxID=798071 RepID=A0A8K0R2I3_9PLEO|nr:hypothetical protein FB567DRAFT_94607 [Paraphoma chrysanthemicola]